MSKAHCCDFCGKLIKDEDVRISVTGFSVIQNAANSKMPKGFSVAEPEDFCSFICLSGWAIENQKILDDYLEISKKPEEESKNGEQYGESNES